MRGKQRDTTGPFASEVELLAPRKLDLTLNLRHSDTQAEPAIGGTLASPSTAYIYNWNMLPVGQQLWLKELESYAAFAPLQDPESYNLVQVLQQVKQMANKNPIQ